MKALRVLVGCECSGTVRDAFLALGHEAVSCDLLPSENGGPHFQQDLLELLRASKGKFDIGVFHPPCDYLTVSGNRWFADDAEAAPGILTGEARREAQKEAARFVEAIWECDIPRIAIENPIGRLSTLWRKPDQVVQPYYFGDPFFEGDVSLAARPAIASPHIGDAAHRGASSGMESCSWPNTQTGSLGHVSQVCRSNGRTMDPTPMTPPPPTPDPTPKADSGAGVRCFDVYGCPHCGELNSLSFERSDEYDEEDDPNPQYQIVCDVHDAGCGASSGFFYDPTKAVESWNARVSLNIAFTKRLICGPSATPPAATQDGQQSDPALAGAEAREQRMENLCRRLMRWDLQYPKGTVHNKTGEKELDAIINEAASLALEPRPLAPAPAPEGRGETAEDGFSFFQFVEKLRDALNTLAARCGFPKVEDSVQLLGAVGNFVERIRSERDAAVAQAQALRKAAMAGREALLAFGSAVGPQLKGTPKIAPKNPLSCAYAYALDALNKLTAALAASEAGK